MQLLVWFLKIYWQNLHMVFRIHILGFGPQSIFELPQIYFINVILVNLKIDYLPKPNT